MHLLHNINVIRIFNDIIQVFRTPFNPSIFNNSLILFDNDGDCYTPFNVPKLNPFNNNNNNNN